MKGITFIHMWKPQKPLFRTHKKDIFEKVAKTGDFIYHIGETSLLRQVSKPVILSKIKTPEFQKKIKYLKSCLRKYRRITGLGRGITGVQVGIPERVAVIYILTVTKNVIPDLIRDLENGLGSRTSGVFDFRGNDNVRTDKNNNLLIIINPKITKVSKTLVRYPEVCMSANPLIAPVIRPSWIEFEYYTEDGEKKMWNMKDDTKEGMLYNRVFQHEIDHMDGIINIDRVQSKEILFELDPHFYEKATFEKVTTKKNETPYI